MVKQKDSFAFQEEVEKAGYNQAARITETLAMLRNSYISAMTEDNFSSALKICRRVVDIISAKIPDEVIASLNEKIYKIRIAVSWADVTYEDEVKRRVYQYPRLRYAIEKAMENLWRKIEKLQDKHGYGMLAEEEYGL